MPNLPISGLPAASALDGTELLPFVQSGVTTQATAQDILNADLPVTSSGITLSGDIVPSTPQGATLGSVDKPFAELYLQSGSISIESDTPGDPSALISNISGNLEISVGGMLLVEPGNSFIAETGSFQYISGSLTQLGSYIRIGNTITTGSVDFSGSFTASLTENHVWIGDSNNRSTEISASSLATYLTSSFITPSQTGSLVNTTYGLFNQTGSYTGVSASLDEGSLIGGGVGTLSVPANGFTQGDAYQATLSGTCTFHNGDELQIIVKNDSQTLADTGIITLTRADLERWNLTIDFSIHQIGGAGTASIASSGIFQYTQHASSTFSGRNFGSINNTTFDTTADSVLEITAQFNHNDNVIATDIFTLKKTY